MKEKIEINIDGQKFEAEHRTFSSGKQGFGLYGKIEIDKKRCQISLNIIELEK